MLRQRGKPRLRETPADLPTWVKAAIWKHDLQGKSWKQVANEIGRTSPQQLTKYVWSPGAKAYRAKLKEVIDDPSAAARFVASQDSAFWLAETYAHFEACKATGDLAEAGRTLRQMLKVAKVELPEANGGHTGPTLIQINMGNATYTTEIPQGESLAELVLPAEIIQ